MRLLHTADWHLGRAFYGTHLTEDQAFALESFHALARDVKPDAVLIAGDVYDRAVPPPEAVELLDETLCRLASDLAVPIVVIAGNHDDPRRLGFASRLLERSGVILAGSLTDELPSVGVQTAEGAFRVWAVPFAEPAEVRDAYRDEAIRGHEAALGAVLGRVRSAVRPGERNVLVGHAFVTGASVSESERPLSVGGTGEVPRALFEGFDYVALGHLHRPQQVGEAHIRYSGSLLKYSFDEAAHAKSVSIVEIAEDGAVRIEEASLDVRRDLRKVRGTLEDLLHEDPGPGRDDYIWADLTDTTPVFDAIGRLREVYPNVMYAARVESAVEASGDGPSLEHLGKLEVPELFEGFFEYATDEELGGTGRELLVELLEDARRSDREAGR